MTEKINVDCRSHCAQNHADYLFLLCVWFVLDCLSKKRWVAFVLAIAS